MMIIKLTLCLQLFTTLKKNPGQNAGSGLWPVTRPDPDPNCWPGDPVPGIPLIWLLYIIIIFMHFILNLYIAVQPSRGNVDLQQSIIHFYPFVLPNWYLFFEIHDIMALKLCFKLTVFYINIYCFITRTISVSLVYYVDTVLKAH